MKPEARPRLLKFAMLVNALLFALAIYLILTDDPAGWRNIAIPAGMLVILMIAGRPRR